MIYASLNDMFKDRLDAANQLAEKLTNHPNIKSINNNDILVLSIPRGGVPIGDVIARKLNCDHQVIISKKLGSPNQSELAIGAIAENSPPFLNQDLIDRLGISRNYLDREITNVRQKIRSYQTKFRQGRSLSQLLPKIKVILLVDDGLVTGETMKACIKWLKSKSQEHSDKTNNPKPSSLSPKQFIVAVPVSSRDTAEEIRPLVDHFICPNIPDDFFALSQFYQNFPQVTDEQVIKLLAFRN